jgi:hypothetical protein
MPGAGLSHGPPAEKNAGGRYHRFSQDIPAFPAQWLYGLLRVLPGAPGFLATVTRVMRSIITSVIPASGYQDHAT